MLRAGERAGLEMMDERRCHGLEQKRHADINTAAQENVVVPARVWLIIGSTFVVFAALLFGAAGTLRWTAAWIYLALFFGASALLSLLLARRDPALLAERMKSPVQKGQPLWDKVFLIGLHVVWCSWLILMGLDIVRFRWSAMPSWLGWIGGAALIAGLWISYRTLMENTYLAPVVKIQRERGQHVISTGPYAIIRHPFYAGAVLLIIATPLMLGSWYGLAASTILVGALVFRIIMEERELGRNLEGYVEYTQRVRYRLAPLIW